MVRSELIRRLDARAAGFEAELSALLAWDDETRPAVIETVRAIVNDVRRRGDVALIEYTNRFDRRRINVARELEQRDFADLGAGIPPALHAALRTAADRIRAYHEHQKLESWEYREADGTFYVKLLAADGRLLLQSTGFVQPQQAAQLVALLKNGFAVHTLPTTVSLADGVGLADVATALAFFEIGKSNAEH